MTTKNENIIYSGKRKTAIAKLRIHSGNGNVYYNFLPITELNLFHKLALLEPLRIYENVLGEHPKHDFYIKTSGGGKEAQIQAARLTLARALVSLTGSDILKKTLIKYDRNILVEDSRRKEARKPGDSKARTKRQKSYR
jgi:ribosomal protein S9